MEARELADVLVEVAPGMVVLRKAGKWAWHSRAGSTKADVVKEIQDQVRRTSRKITLLSEALESLKRDSP